MLFLFIFVILAVCMLKFIGENPGFVFTFILMFATLGFIFYTIGSHP